jgi:nucleotide-binding universal stress UspA family protein
MAVRPRKAFRMTLKIVVAVDFSAESSRALDEAMRLVAHLPEDELHPVYVLTQDEAVDPREEMDLLEQQLTLQRDRLMEYTIQHGNEAGVQFDQKVVFHVRIGDPAKQIQQVAIDMDADLIIVGTRGNRGLKEMILGSVARALVKDAPCPVMVAKPKVEREKTEWFEEPPPEGVDLHQQRVMRSENLRFGRRPSSISGLV